MWVQSLGGEDPVEEGMATHSSILAWRIPWTEGPGGLQSIGSQRVRHDWSSLACTRVTTVLWIFDSHCLPSFCECRYPRCRVGRRFAVCSPESWRSGTSLGDPRGKLCWILMACQVEKCMWKAASPAGSLTSPGFCFLLCVLCLFAPCLMPRRPGDCVYFKNANDRLNIQGIPFHSFP